VITLGWSEEGERGEEIFFFWEGGEAPWGGGEFLQTMKRRILMSSISNTIAKVEKGYRYDPLASLHLLKPQLKKNSSSHTSGQSLLTNHYRILRIIGYREVMP
jgi:hypothetical protein